jgi:hypothetical protein
MRRRRRRHNGPHHDLADTALVTHPADSKTASACRLHKLTHRLRIERGPRDELDAVERPQEWNFAIKLAIWMRLSPLRATAASHGRERRPTVPRLEQGDTDKTAMACWKLTVPVLRQQLRHLHSPRGLEEVRYRFRRCVAQCQLALKVLATEQHGTIPINYQIVGNTRWTAGLDIIRMFELEIVECLEFASSVGKMLERYLVDSFILPETLVCFTLGDIQPVQWCGDLYEKGGGDPVPHLCQFSDVFQNPLKSKSGHQLAVDVRKMRLDVDDNDVEASKHHF